jgi:hypothetical protein
VELLLLLQIASPHVTDLVLEFGLHTKEPEEWIEDLNSRVDWEGTYKILAGPVFSNLQRVKLVVDIKSPPEDSVLRDKLPACHSRGIVDDSFGKVEIY